VLATPASSATIQEQLSKLSALRTPKTEPRPDRGEMHPELVHQTTTKAPDSGLRFGFVDVPAKPLTSLASLQNTPSKSHSALPFLLSSPTFDFRSGSELPLSSEAQKLMENVRKDAARIKVQIQAEKAAQEKKDAEAEQMFNGTNASGRKIAKPKSRTGRFSGAHMAQFKKMDSIENHPSSFRAKPDFTRPTTHALKRTGSRAGLDEPERPKTAGKGTPGRIPPPFLGKATSVSPFKSIPSISDRDGSATTAKRVRRLEPQDSTASRPPVQPQPPRSTAIPQPSSSRFLSPTKASMARAVATQPLPSSPNKSSALSRTDGGDKLFNKTSFDASLAQQALSHDVPSAPGPSRLPPRVEGTQLERPLPALPADVSQNLETTKPWLQRSRSTTELADPAKSGGFSSKLPTFSGLKSILRSARKSCGTSSSGIHRSPTPKRPNTATSATGSVKKVDFTPSVKSRYAVKLAAGSPSPAKLPHLTPAKPATPFVPFDPAAYAVEDDGDDNWEGEDDTENEVMYPTLPELTPPPAVSVGKTFSEMAKEHNRRESKEFKSIFTTLHHPSRPTPPSTLPSVDTVANKTKPTTHANKVVRSPHHPNLSKPSPFTIRRVRASGVTDIVQPFEDADIKTVPHGLPGKKRRRESAMGHAQHETDEDEEDTKENRRMSVTPSIPGRWEDTILDEGEGSNHDDDQHRRKRARIGKSEEPASQKGEVKKRNAARQAAANTARQRKSQGILSLSRLNMLSRPKQRG